MVDPTPAGRRIVIWMVLLVAVLAAVDAITGYARTHQMRWVPLVASLCLIVSAGMMARRPRG